MNIKVAGIVTCLGICLVVVGCRWNDDFRSRIQPQPKTLEPEPTFNVDSPDYVGDDVAHGLRDTSQDELVEPIDELSDIPDLPDSPTPIR